MERLVSDTPTMLITDLGDDAEALVTRFLDVSELRARVLVFDPVRLEKIGAVRASVFVYFEWHLRDAYGVKVIAKPGLYARLVDRGVISLGMGRRRRRAGRSGPYGRSRAGAEGRLPRRRVGELLLRQVGAITADRAPVHLTEAVGERLTGASRYAASSAPAHGSWATPRSAARTAPRPPTARPRRSDARPTLRAGPRSRCVNSRAAPARPRSAARLRRRARRRRRTRTAVPSQPFSSSEQTTSRPSRTMCTTRACGNAVTATSTRYAISWVCSTARTDRRAHAPRGAEDPAKLAGGFGGRSPMSRGSLP